MAGNNNHPSGHRYGGHVTYIVGVTKVSEDSSIKIPTYALPIVAAAISFLMGYAAMQANAAATENTVERIEAEVREAAQKAEAAGTTGKLNEQAIQQITRNLSEMQETAKASDQKLQQLINIMIQQAQQ